MANPDLASLRMPSLERAISLTLSQARNFDEGKPGERELGMIERGLRYFAASALPLCGIEFVYEVSSEG